MPWIGSFGAKQEGVANTLQQPHPVNEVDAPQWIIRGGSSSRSRRLPDWIIQGQVAA